MYRVRIFWKNSLPELVRQRAVQFSEPKLSDFGRLKCLKSHDFSDTVRCRNSPC